MTSGSDPGSDHPAQPDPASVPADPTTYGQPYGNPYPPPGWTSPAPPPPAPPPPAPAPDYTLAPPLPTYGAPGWNQPGYGYIPPQPGMVPEHPRATTALVLGIVGIAGVVLCGFPLLASPFAIFVGHRVMKEVDASNGALGGHGKGVAGFVMGIIGTVILVLVLAVIGLLVYLAATGQLEEGPNNTTTTSALGQPVS